MDTKKAWFTGGEFTALRGFSDWVARPFGKIPPNLISLFRIPFVIPVAYVLDLDMHLLGLILGTVLFLSDLIDGALARYQTRVFKIVQLSYEEEVKLGLIARCLLLGKTYLGKEIDPIGDKIAVFVLLLVLGVGIVDTFGIVMVGVLAVILTLMRPIRRRYGIDDEDKDGDANFGGKHKLHVEIICLITLDLTLWLAPEHSALFGNITLGLAIVMAVISLYGHICCLRQRPSKS